VADQRYTIDRSGNGDLTLLVDGDPLCLLCKTGSPDWHAITNEFKRRDKLLAEMDGVIEKLLLSSDVSWAANNLGHGWPEAVQAALDIRAKYKDQK